MAGTTNSTRRRYGTLLAAAALVRHLLYRAAGKKPHPAHAGNASGVAAVNAS